jgi:hypothetical protein
MPLLIEVVELPQRMERMTSERNSMKQNRARLDPQAALDRVANRAAELLKESEDPQAEMHWAENRLFEAGLLPYTPKRSSPQVWAEQALAQNLDIMEESLPWLKERDNLGLAGVETFEGLILALIPMEGGL